MAEGETAKSGSYDTVVAILALIIGLGACSPLERFIKATMREFDLQGGIWWMLLWAIAILLILVVIIPVSRAFNRVIETKKRKARQKTLKKLLDDILDIRSQLATLASELQRDRNQTQPNPRSDDNLHEATQKTLGVIDLAERGAYASGVRVYAPEVAVLLTSVSKHHGREVVNPMHDLIQVRGDLTLRIRKSIWGVGCVELLLEQLRDAIHHHPIFPN